jgi:hypothetical protein
MNLSKSSSGQALVIYAAALKQLLATILLRDSWELILRLRLVYCDNDTDDHGNDNKDDDHNEEAPPLLAVAGARADDGGANFLVALSDVFADLLALSFDVGNKRLLLLHNLVEVLEELGKLDHLALNVLDGLMALLDVAQGGARLAAAVRAHELGS